MNKIKILAIPGSLRAASSSNAILRKLKTYAPEGVDFVIYNGLASLPHFDDREDVPDTVSDFRRQLKEADAILICTPEYAFGVPGSLKNALDWTVSTADFMDKPVSLITASSSGEKGHAALLMILGAISARVIEEAAVLISFVRAKVNKEGEITDPATEQSLRAALTALINSVPGK